jgi:hypothetical protein
VGFVSCPPFFITPGAPPLKDRVWFESFASADLFQVREAVMREFLEAIFPGLTPWQLEVVELAQGRPPTPLFCKTRENEAYLDAKALHATVFTLANPNKKVLLAHADSDRAKDFAARCVRLLPEARRIVDALKGGDAK